MRGTESTVNLLGTRRAVLPFLPWLLAALAAPAGADVEQVSGPRDRLVAVLSQEQRTALAFLEHLGWRIVAGAPGDGVEVRGGYPCRYATLEEAQAAGALVIAVSQDATAAQLAKLATGLAPLADTLPSRCAWKLRVAPAVEEATRKLAANTKRGKYTFPQILFVDSLWFRMVPPQPEWSKGKTRCVALVEPSIAVSSFYTREAVAECYVGQWVAIYATALETYGAEAFDEAIRTEELVLGRPQEMREAPFGRYLTDEYSSTWRSLVIGPEDYAVDPGLAMARMGPTAFCGATGVVENVEQELSSNDNLVIVSVSPRANQTLLEKGGFASVLRLTEAAWKAHEEGRRDRRWGSSGVEGRDAVDEILTDPVLTEIRVYVHPYGVVPLRKVVEERVGRIHRPVKVRIYRNGVEDAFYQRYRQWFCSTRAPVVLQGE